MYLFPSFIRFLLYFGGVNTVLAAASCYNVRSIQLSSAYTPCNSASGSVSQCCGGTRGDVCLSNGLCQYKLTSKSEPSYWREGCTDKSWKSAYCLKGVCTGSSDIDGDGDAEMTPCDGTSTSVKWCCGKGNKSCCGTGKEVVLAAMPGVGSVKSSSSAAAAAAAVTVSTSTSTPALVPVGNDVSSPTPTAGIVQTQNQNGASSQSATPNQDQQSDLPVSTPSLSGPQTQVPDQSQAQSTTAAPLPNPDAPSSTQQGSSFPTPASLAGTRITTNSKAAVLQTSLRPSSTLSSNTPISSSASEIDTNTNAGVNLSLTSAAKAGIAVGLAILLLTAASIVLYICVVRKSGTWRSRHDVVEIVEYQPQMSVERERTERATKNLSPASWARPRAAANLVAERAGKWDVSGTGEEVIVKDGS